MPKSFQQSRVYHVKREANRAPYWLAKSKMINIEGVPQCVSDFVIENRAVQDFIINEMNE